MPTEQQRRANLKLALILAAVAATFLFGFLAKMIWLNS
jgi:hypothetical protein